MFDSLTNALSGSPWTYLLVLAIVAGDAVLPIFPGETAVITAAIIASNGNLSIILVVVASIAGAMLGDNTSYGIGRGLGHRAIDRFARSDKAKQRVEWSAHQIRRRGAWMVVVARFIPGGRTATTLAAGTLGMDWRRFIAADAVGATLWSLYAAGLGWFGGSAFQDSLWKPLLVAGGIAAVIALGGEGVRRLLERRGGREAHGS